MGEVFAYEDEFPLALFVTLGDGIEFIADSSLSCEESGRLLMWDFQYDSCLSVSCRCGLFDYYWVPSSAWLAFLMVDCCELSLRSSLLEALTHEFSSRLASTLWLGDVIQ